MNPLLTRPPDDIVTDALRTHWIDTNVMLEVYSHGDLYLDSALKRVTNPSGLNNRVNPEDRRVRMQQSLWLSMSLASSSAVTLSYQHENLENILRLAPPDSDVGRWTSDILYVLGDGGVFDGWERILTVSGADLTNRDRDRLITRVCCPATLAHAPGTEPARAALIEAALAQIREHTQAPLTLVTRDGRLTREARAVGVEVGTPEAIAARTLSLDPAREMFLSRLRQAIERRLACGAHHSWLARKESLDGVLKVYEMVWDVEPPDWQRLLF